MSTAEYGCDGRSSRMSPRSAGHSRSTSSGPSRSASTGSRSRPDTRTHQANAALPGSPGKQCRPGTMPTAAGTSVDSPHHQPDAPDQLQPYTKHTLLKQICSTCVLVYPRRPTAARLIHNEGHCSTNIFTSSGIRCSAGPGDILDDHINVPGRLLSVTPTTNRDLTSRQRTG